MKRAPASSLDAAGPPVRGLAALASLARAVAAADDLMQTLEMAAEEARAALGASAVSIAVPSSTDCSLKVLVNVGALAEGEVRFPTDEVYPFDQFPAVETLLLKGQPYRWCVRLPRRGALHRRVVAPGWPQLRARRADHGRRRGVGGAVGRDCAGRLTAQHRRHRVLAGRRAVRRGCGRPRRAHGSAGAPHVRGLADRPRESPRTRRTARSRARRAEITGRPVSLLVFDIDGMKEVNDRFGHDTGDEALIAVADGLRAASPTSRVGSRSGSGATSSASCSRVTTAPRPRSWRRTRSDGFKHHLGPPAVCLMRCRDDRPWRLATEGAVSLGGRGEYAAKRALAGVECACRSRGGRPHRRSTSALAVLPRSH